MNDIVLITIDSLRQDRIIRDYHKQVSPNIDGLIDDSVVFGNSFAHAGSTRFSFPSILSSVYSPMYGGIEDLPEGMFLPELLKRDGYSTAGFHSNPFLNYGYSKGFDRFIDPKDKDSVTSKIRQHLQRNLSHNGFIYNTIKRIYEEVEQVIGTEIGTAYIDAPKMTDYAVEWAKANKSERKFIWIHYMDPHHPYLPPEWSQRELHDEVIPKKESMRLRRKMLDSPSKLTNLEVEKIVKLYDSEVRFTDKHVGRLVQSLREWCHDPIFILTSDHGEQLGEHGGFSHGTYREECLRVPLIISDAPDEMASRLRDNQDELVGLVDIPPTVSDMVNGKKPKEHVGLSLLDQSFERNKIIGGWAEQDKLVSFCRKPGLKAVYDDGELLLFDVSDNLETQLSDSVPEGLSNGISEFKSRVGSTDSQIEDVDPATETRLRELGYLE